MENIKQSTFSKLMSGIIMILCVVVLISGIGTMASFNSTRNNMTNEKNFTSAATTLLDGMDYLTQQIQSYAQFGEETFHNNYMKEVNETKRVDNALSQMQSFSTDQAFQEQINKISDYNNKLIAIEDEAMQLIKRGKLAEARKLLFGQEYTSNNEQIHSISDSLIQGMSNAISQKINYDSKKVMVMGIITIVSTLILILLQLINVVYTMKHIIYPILKLKDGMVVVSNGILTEPIDVKCNHTELGQLAKAIETTKNNLSEYIQEISSILEQIARQDLRAAVEKDYIGDFSSIKKSLNTIIVSLNQAFSTINESVEQVSSGSDQVSSGAQALSQGATEQASAVEELAATINEISQQIKNNAENAVQASEKANSVGDEMTESNHKMKELIQAIQEISSSSNEIGKIIKTIEDIAFQTNILALNAAVEAARAGAAGKGFAVVADEVRNLASKSAEASQSTSTLIETSIRAVEHGTQIADMTAQSLLSAVDGAKMVAQTIDKISEASNNQANSIAQVTSGVDQISSVVQTNSATAEESAAASEELSGQAQMLKNLMGKYQLKDTSIKNETAMIQNNYDVPMESSMVLDGNKY